MASTTVVYLVILLALPCIQAADKCAGVFDKGEQTPTDNNILCYDVEANSGSKQYCIEYECGKTNCTNPIKPVVGCPYCPGTCLYGNLVVKEDDSTCPDDCTSCTCSTFEENEKKMTTTFHKCSLPTPPKLCL